MFRIDWTTPLGILELLLGIFTFVLLIRSGSLKSYWPLLYIVLWQVVPSLVLLWLREGLPFQARTAYIVYFYVYWFTFACAAVASVLLTYTIFEDTLRPLKGLQNLGRIMYRWVLGISCAVMFSAAFGAANSTLQPTVRVVSELMRLSGIVVLCLLIFVGFTIRPLGLSLRSRTFGVSVGMAIIVSANILLTGGFVLSKAMKNTYNLLLTGAGIAAQLIWIWYFAVQEPQRRFVLLSTTSPFHQWNLAAERMGYDPGYVAIGGVPPSSLAEAERHIFERIAAQDNGSAPRLNELSAGAGLPLGWTSSTENATERFNRIWNMRYGSSQPDNQDPGNDNQKAA